MLHFINKLICKCYGHHYINKTGSFDGYDYLCHRCRFDFALTDEGKLVLAESNEKNTIVKKQYKNLPEDKMKQLNKARKQLIDIVDLMVTISEGYDRSYEVDTPYELLTYSIYSVEDAIENIDEIFILNNRGN